MTGEGVYNMWSANYRFLTTGDRSMAFPRESALMVQFCIVHCFSMTTGLDTCYIFNQLRELWLNIDFDT